MAPSNKVLEAKLKKAVEDMYAENPELLTVKNVRNRVESDITLGLEVNFFNSPKWKTRSKKLITEWAVSKSII